MSLAAGAKLGPYEIVSPLGSGGMGEVYRARDARLGRDVAVKVLPAAFAADPERLARFEQEARAAAALNHPNIVAVHDIGVDAGRTFVVTELLEGDTLRGALAHGALPLRKALDYGVQIAQGLAAAHARGIVHRDLKPENIFVCHDGRVKVLDFGLAKLAEAAAAGAGATMVATRAAETTPGMVLGTVGYMSPEQVRGLPADARTDIFSFGAVLYETVAGQRAFKGETAADTISAILKDDPPELALTNSSVAPAIDRIIRHCLEKSPEQRFQSIRDVGFDLQAITGTGTAPATVVARDARDRRARRLAIAAALVGAAALVFLAGWIARSRTSTGEREPAAFKQLTFRRGRISTARFAPDGQTVIYAAAWEGKPFELYSTRPGNPESRPIGLQADLAAISSTGELAVLLNPVDQGPGWARSGTLGRVPLEGGAPREIVESVAYADWSPDGKDLAVARIVGGVFDVEYPAGHALFTVPSAREWISHLRVSPDGSRVAFLYHSIGGDEGSVEVVDRTGKRTTISRDWISLQGLAWRSPTEVWFTGTRVGANRALWAATISGVGERLVARAPYPLVLTDLHGGRALVRSEAQRSMMLFAGPNDDRERDLSWFDYATGATLSADGKRLFFTESGEGAGTTYGVFMRPTDGSPAVRLGDGGGGRVAPSPDGKWVATMRLAGDAVVLLPVGAGEPRTLARGPVERISAVSWMPDSRRVVFVGSGQGAAPRTYVQSIDRGDPKPLLPPGLTGVLVSPDGQWINGNSPDKRLLVSLTGGADRPLAVNTGERIVGWGDDSRSLYVARPLNGGVAATVERLDVFSGTRTRLRDIGPGDTSGIAVTLNLSVSRDGRSIVASYVRLLGDLFVVDSGVR